MLGGGGVVAVVGSGGVRFAVVAVNLVAVYSLW